MFKKLTRHGNSLALVIDKPILQLLGIDENSKLEIVTDGLRLMVIPPPKASHRAKVDALIKASHIKYAEVYRALSEPTSGEFDSPGSQEDAPSSKNETSANKAASPKNRKEQLKKWLEKENKRNSNVYKALAKPL